MAEEDLQTKRFPSSVSIWPPSQRPREAVIRRLVDTLTNPSSVISKRFGTVPSADAETVAQSIEQESLAAVSANGLKDSVEEGIEALQLYSKEISERLLDFSKSRAGKDNSNESRVSEANSGEGAAKGKDDEEEERSVDGTASEEASV